MWNVIIVNVNDIIKLILKVIDDDTTVMIMRWENEWFTRLQLLRIPSERVALSVPRENDVDGFFLWMNVRYLASRCAAQRTANKENETKVVNHRKFSKVSANLFGQKIN